MVLQSPKSMDAEALQKSSNRVMRLRIGSLQHTCPQCDLPTGQLMGARRRPARVIDGASLASGAYPSLVLR